MVIRPAVRPVWQVTYGNYSVFSFFHSFLSGVYFKFGRHSWFGLGSHGVVVSVVLGFTSHLFDLFDLKACNKPVWKIVLCGS